MSLPVVTIVGRPNVGKSSLFNSITRSRISIVEPTAGVTRDRVSTICDIDETYFELVDTGGYGVVDRDDLSADVEKQIEYAIQCADLILFVVDAREGLLPLDHRTAELLRPYTSRVRLLSNKVDEPHMAHGIGEFIKLGFGEPLAVSAVNGSGRNNLIALIAEGIAGLSDETPVEPVMKIALVGKRNAGKSTFINVLAGEPRVIVSETPGTTRDSIDVRFEKDGRTLIAIDTAGVRKKNRMADDIEFYAYTRATQSIRRADVVLFLIDATEPVGQVEKRLAQLVSQEFKPCVFVVNKWDLAKGQVATGEFGEYLDKLLPELDYAPISFTSANVGRNIDSTLDLAAELHKQAGLRVGTGKLNKVLGESLAVNPPSTKRGKKRPKFYFATQVSTLPPAIVLFVNHPGSVTPSHHRFLLNRFRESLPFGEVPIRLMFRPRRQGMTALAE